VQDFERSILQTSKSASMSSFYPVKEYSFAGRTLAVWLAGLVFALSGCEEVIQPPAACFTTNVRDAEGNLAETNTVKVGQLVTFLSCSSNVSYLALYTGEPGRARDEYAATGVEFPVRTGLYEYTYKIPGTYTVTFLASQYGKDKKILRSEAVRVITVEP